MVIEYTCDNGDTAFMLFASTMVFIMTPSMALAQAGMIRRKNALSMLMQIMTGVALGSMLYFLIGFSISFGPSMGGLIGTLEHAMLLGVPVHKCTDMFPNSDTVPEGVFFAYQMMFAIHTPLITTGAWVEKMNFNAFLVFIVLWPILVYYPLSHAVWNSNGFLLKWGVLDYAGGIVIHTSSGVAGFVVSLMMVRRKPNSPGTAHHNLLIAYLGCALVFAGWYSFIAGAGGRADGQAVNAFVCTHVAACSGAFMWIFIGYYRERKWRVTGVISGVFAGLGSITAAAGYVDPYAAMFIGAFGGTLSYISAWFLKERMLLDDVLDCTSLQGIPGMVGAISIGFFSDSIIPRKGGGGINGLFYDGSATLLGKQVVGTLFGVVWAGFWTWVILKFMSYTSGINITLEEEELGLDMLQMGEQGYDEKLSGHLDLGKDTLIRKLIEASAAGNLGEAQMLVNSKADPNGMDYDLRRPIHLAASEGRIHVVQWLFNMYKVELNVKDRFGSTPMADAYREKRPRIIEWLRSQRVSCHDLDLVIDLFTFSAAADIDGLKLLLNTGIDINTCDYDKRTPLMVAAAEGHEEIVRFLLAKHAKTKLKDRWKKTAAKAAAESGYPKLALDILQASKKRRKTPKGRRTNRRTKLPEIKEPTTEKEFKSPTLSHKDASLQSGGDRRSLLKKAQRTWKSEASLGLGRVMFSDIAESRDSYDEDTAMDSEDDYFEPTVRKLVSGTADIITAAGEGNKKEIQRLIKLSDIGKDLAAESDYDRRTPLHLAAAKGKLEVVEYLVQIPSVNINAVDRWKNTPLKEALRHHHPSVVKFLRLHNAVVINQDAAYRLCSMAAEGDIDGLMNSKKMGCDLNVADYDARTALHLASSEGRYETVNWLLLQGVHHTPKDRFGNTPLDDAIREDFPEIVELLNSQEKVQ